MVDTILQFSESGIAKVSLVNCLGITQRLEKGAEIGGVAQVEAVDSVDVPEEEWRKQQLRDHVNMELFDASVSEEEAKAHNTGGGI